jgi:pimeloyl-ACP methyl ester carboxylesterase
VIRGGGWLILSLLTPALACTTPVGVRRVAPKQVHQALTANVLTTGRPSAASTQILHRLDRFDLYQDDPDAAIRALRAESLEAAEPTDLLFALAELEFHRGQRIRGPRARAHFLAAAVYASGYLVRASRGVDVFALDPRVRVAADLYNRGLTSGLASEDGETVDLSARSLPLSFGEMDLQVEPDDLVWGGYRMTGFVPVAELEVRGLRNRYRRPGLGAPLAAALEPADLDDPPPGYGHISGGVRVAATALVFFDESATSLEGSAISAKLRVLTLDDATSVELGNQQVALEFEPTAALAFGLAESRPWDFERWGFLSGDFGTDRDRGLRMMSPYDRNRIPVVFVHGTASSPGRWAEMINHLQSNTEILTGYQFWIFQYNTGNPIPFSGGLLRQSLTDLVAILDPEGDDENLKRMVVVGHSQGGLLAKLCVVDSGDTFWSLVSSAPIETLDLRPETREILQRSLFFRRLPFVRSVVFVATPHRGSFVAERWYSRFASGMVSLPRDLADATGDLLSQDDDRVFLRSLDDMPSSIDNMTRDSVFLSELARMPIAPGVDAHSIIAALPEHEDLETAHDGVVSVESARLEGAVSERIVRSGHSTQVHPLTIAEVARILQVGLGSSSQPSGDSELR